MYDFSLLGSSATKTPFLVEQRPQFIGSYPPVTPPGQQGGFFVNTYFLQPDRKSELVGPVPVRANDCRKFT
jgi:hypothetical protein